MLANHSTIHNDVPAGPALPLGELGNCLRPPSGRGPQNFRKEPGSRGKEKKKLVSNELQK